MCVVLFRLLSSSTTTGGHTPSAPVGGASTGSEVRSDPEETAVSAGAEGGKPLGLTDLNDVFITAQDFEVCGEEGREGGVKENKLLYRPHQGVCSEF